MKTPGYDKLMQTLQLIVQLVYLIESVMAQIEKY